MSEQLLAVLKLCVLALIYLFFLRVLSAVWVEVHGPRRARSRRAPAAVAAPGGDLTTAGVVVAPAPPAAPAASARRVLRVLEPPALAGGTITLERELTLGRAPGCDVQLDDTYVSQLHARVGPGPEGAVVDDCNSTNGTYVNRTKVQGPTPLRPGDRLQVGNVVMELA